MWDMMLYGHMNGQFYQKLHIGIYKKIFMNQFFNDQLVVFDHFVDMIVPFQHPEYKAGNC